MGTATSASRVCSAPASASLYTATERMPISRRVRITRTAISPRFATSTVSNIVSTPHRGSLRKTTRTCWRKSPWRRSHPEDAVADVLEGRVGARGQGQAEHGAGLRGVDHAVVPEPRRGVVGVALELVLVADRRLERLLVGGRPVLTAGLQPVAPDLGQHTGRLLAAHDRDPRVGPGEQEPGRVR